MNIAGDHDALQPQLADCVIQLSDAFSGGIVGGHDRAIRAKNSAQTFAFILLSARCGMPTSSFLMKSCRDQASDIAR